jgi:hypothetical protein
LVLIKRRQILDLTYVIFSLVGDMGRAAVVSIIFRPFWFSNPVVGQPNAHGATKAPGAFGVYVISMMFSINLSMLKYCLTLHLVPAIYRCLTATSIKADCPSGNAPKTLARSPITLSV